MVNTSRRCSQPARPFTRSLVLVLALAALLGGCGGGDDQPPALTGEVSPREGAAFGAAELRAELTAALTAHPYLLGAAITAEVDRLPTEGGDDDERGALDAAAPGAREALDRNSIELAGVLGEAYGEDFRESFLEAWRELAIDQLARARILTEGNPEAARDLSSRIADQRLAIGRLLEAVNENLTAKGVAKELKPLVTATNDAAGLAIDEKRGGLESLRTGAQAGASIAEVLATAIATQLPESYRGDADSSAAALRAELTASLMGHVYLVGLDPQAPSTSGGSPGLSPTDRNSFALRSVITDAYGRSAGRLFLPGWRAHTDLLRDYFEASRRQEVDLSTRIEGQLDDYRGRLARLIAEADPGISVEQVSEALRPYFSSTLELLRIEAAGGGDPEPAEAMRDAARTMPPLAAELADSVVSENPGRFPATSG